MSSAGSTLTSADFELGLVVSTVGDFDGDGIVDFVVAGRNDPDQNGSVYLVYGDDDGLPQSVDLDAMTSDEGFAIGGASVDEMLGFSVRNAGDVNGDGFDDVIIGSPGASPEYTYIYTRFDGYTRFYTTYIPVTYTYVYTGSTYSGATYTEVRTYVGGYNTYNSYYYGTAIPYTYTNTRANAGSAYVIFGTDTGPTSIDVKNMGGNGIIIAGARGNEGIGVQVAGVSDFNGDGTDDMAVSTTSYLGNERVYIIFGDDSGGLSNVDLGDTSPSESMVLQALDAGKGFGLAMSASGDINGDGFGDVVVGEYNADTSYTYTNLTFGGYFTTYTNVGQRTYTQFGTYSTYSGGTTTYSYFTYQPYTYFYTTYIQQTYTNTYTGTTLSGGKAYVFFGSDSLSGAPIVTSGLTGSNGFTFVGITDNERVGSDVAMIGDVNDDGFDDVMIGATGANAGAGAAYVVFGGAGAMPTSLSANDLNSSTGFIVTGNVTSQSFGRTVAGVGDVNGDGIDDFMVADSTVVGLGRAHLFFGRDDGSLQSGVSASGIDGSTGFTFAFGPTFSPGEFATEISGGDVNGDGVSDIIIGSSGESDPASAIVIAGDLEALSFMDRLDGTEDGVIDMVHYLAPRVAGTSGDDRLFGDGIDAMMHGLSGADTLNGGSGNDTIQAAADADVVYAGIGADSVLAGYGNDTVFGGDGTDFIRGGRGHDVLQGNNGHDTLFGDKGHDNLSGNNGHDELNGSGGNDKLNGNNGHDTLLGGAGNDTIFGGRGRDVINGGDGADVLFDGLGEDQLTGGAGADVFRFVSDGAFDTLQDFEDGLDMVDLGAWNVTAVSLTFTYLAAGSVELSGDGEILMVYGSGGAALNAGNFTVDDILF